MGFLDRAKKLAEQAREKAEEALAEVKARSAAPGSPGGGGSAPPAFGTPYVPGMLGREGWRERGLPDPAAVLPVKARDRVGIAHTTRSEILGQPFGLGRRWSNGERSAGLFYRLDPDHHDWRPPGGQPTPVAAVPGASAAALDDGRTLVFVATGDREVVLETRGLDEAAITELAGEVARTLASA